MQTLHQLRQQLLIFAFLALASLSITVYMGKAHETSLQALDSTTHAMLALEVTQKTLPVLPMKNFETNLKKEKTFNDHPFTLFYLSGLAMRAFGPSAWSARLVPTLFSVGCVLLLAWLGMLMYTPTVGLVAGMILLLTRDFILVGSRFHLDTPMIFFIVLSFITWWKKMPYLTGIVAGLGLWMKTPVALLIFPSALFALWMTGQLNKKEFLNIVKSGVVAVFFGFGIWVITALLTSDWSLATDYWHRQVWGTAVKGRGAGTPEYLLGIELLYCNYYPWLPLLLFSFYKIFKQKKWKQYNVALPLAAALVLEAVLSTVQFKFFWYFIPVFPFLALLIVESFRDWIEKHSHKFLYAIVGLGIIAPTFLIATPVALGPENFPAFRRFSPIIQSIGTCSDQVLFVDGGEPFGNMLDSIYVLGFYTGRKIIEADCDTVQKLTQTMTPEWIIASTENLQKCFTQELLEPYHVRYKFGRQHLLSRKLSSNSEVDLTPLVNELKPAISNSDCKAAAYPNDGYFPTE